MTTNGHPIPPSPSPTPAERPTFRRLVVEVYEVGAGGKEFVLETVDVETADLIAECQARGLLGTERPGHVTRIERPNITVNGSAAPAEVAEALVDAINEVVGTTPSGEAVRMVGAERSAVGKMPSERMADIREGWFPRHDPDALEVLGIVGKYLDECERERRGGA